MKKITVFLISSVLVLTACSTASQESSGPEAPEVFKAGDRCDNPAEEVVSASGILVCSLGLGPILSFLPVVSSGVFPGQNELAQIPIGECKIEDQRLPELRFSGATSFPAQEYRMPSNGEVTVAIVPIDFPDALGITDPISLIRKDLEAIDAWTEFFTDGRVKYKWIFSSEWLTMPKQSKYYVWDKSYISDGEFLQMSEKQLQSNQDQATQVFSEAEKVMDLETVDYAWIFSNPEAKLVDWGPGPVNSATQTIKTANSSYEFDYFPIGTYLFGNVPEFSHQRPLWTTMLHEMGHAHGLAGHAPGNEWTFDHMTAGGTLNAWNGLLMGWIPDEDFVCLDGSKPAKHTVILDSVDLHRGGTIAALIRLSSYEVLVVESRKKGPFSIDFANPEYSSVMAYYVNSKKAADRFDGNPDREMDYFSYFLRIEEPNRLLDPNPYQVDPNALAELGDTLSFENITIKFASSIGFDTIEIEVLQR